MAGRVGVVAVLGTTQTIAWASSYYMPAILGGPIADALHLPTSVFFGLFSGALLLSAVMGPSAGRLIDRHGGRDSGCLEPGDCCRIGDPRCGAWHRRARHRLDG